MSRAKTLKMDGLDRLRDRLDSMAESLPGWQFQMVGASEPHPISAIQIEAYCPELKKHAGMVILEEHVISGEWGNMLLNMERKLWNAGK